MAMTLILSDKIFTVNQPFIRCYKKYFPSFLEINFIQAYLRSPLKKTIGNQIEGWFN
jgi:hypothetical protein